MSGEMPDASVQDFIRSTKKALSTQATQGATGTSVSIPAGTYLMGAWTDVPAGYLPCDGAAYDRNGYSALFAAIGTTYGAGDGSTTFNVPNWNGRFPRGNNSAPGGTGGTSSHTHALSDNGQAAIGLYASSPSVFSRLIGAATNWASTRALTGGTVAVNGTTESTATALLGSTDSAGTLPPYLDSTIVIKY